MSGAAVEERLARILRLAETDGGFYVLALHAFIEAWVGEDWPAARCRDRFPEMMGEYGAELKGRGAPPSELSILTALSREHCLTDGIRRGFVPLDGEEVLAATHRFLAFCAWRGIGSPQLAKLRERLSAWDDRRFPVEGSPELSRMKAELAVVQRTNPRLLEELGCYERDAAAARRAAGRAEELAAELQRERRRPGGDDERVAELRRALASAAVERRRLADALARSAGVERYLGCLSRLTLYTRARRDYERGAMRLSAEQREAAEAMCSGHDFLLRGGAGTGKTVVLLHAFQRSREERDRELGFGRAGSLALLTYTTTLVKYDRWLADTLRVADGADLIATAESFFLARLRRIDSRWKIDDRAVARLASPLNATGFLTDAELAVELEDFLFANDVTREEYLDDRVVRRGMRQPLSVSQRAEVWGIRARVIEEMERSGTCSKNWSRIKLIEHLGRSPGDPALCDVDTTFVDESQDLVPVDLKALKLLCRRALVMAGDLGQRISSVGSPYTRAGIDIAGRARILKASFRTTCAIQELAERYRARGRAGREEEGPAPQAFREGPVPELYRAAGREALDEMVLEKVSVCTRTLGYGPEEVCVLAPTRGDVARFARLLGRAGLPAADIRGQDFSFGQPGAVRLSTLHSAKGLEFPVVLLYLPALPAPGDYDEGASDTLARNLISVAMTRAMDGLSVFTLEEPTERPLADLVEVCSA